MSNITGAFRNMAKTRIFWIASVLCIICMLKSNSVAANGLMLGCMMVISVGLLMHRLPIYVKRLLLKFAIVRGALDFLLTSGMFAAVVATGGGVMATIAAVSGGVMTSVFLEAYKDQILPAMEAEQPKKISGFLGRILN